MKSKIILYIFLLISFTAISQKKYKLIQPNINRLKAITEKDEALNNQIIQLYLNHNYKAISNKIDIKLDPDFDNIECGYTIKYNFGIIFTTSNCGEAAPLLQRIQFPKTNLDQLKKWVEKIYKADLTDVKNIWKKNEYLPKDDGVGCYYKIKQYKSKSVVEIFCGC